jgi:GAF domain-containing protein
MSEELRSAVAAGVVGSAESFRALLQSTVEVARAIFGAKAASVFLLDEETDELVFEAIAGYGADTLVGRRFPSSKGIAGWVLVTRQPLVIEDVTQDPRFAKDFAESTGYIPKGLMAVPLLHEDRALGVLEVLDRPQRTQFSLVEMDLLGLFANQAAIALDLLRRARTAEAVLTSGGEDAGTLARLATTLEELEEERRVPAFRLLAAVDEVLKNNEGGY